MKDYAFQVLNDDVTEEDLDIDKNHFNMRYEKTRGISQDKYYEIMKKVRAGPSIDVAKSSVWMDLEKEDSLRAVMYDSFDLWDDDLDIFNVLQGRPQEFKTKVITQDKIDVFKLKYQQWENNPNKGDSASTPKEEVFKFLQDNIGKRMYIYC